MTPKQFERMVDNTCKRFSNRHGVVVRQDAIQHIVAPGLPHLADVGRAIATNQMTERMLADSVYSILTNAYLDAKQRGDNFIGQHAVQKSMKRYCPYLFWC